MAVLITGGCGFVGLNLAATLLARNEDVVLFGPAPPPADAKRHLQALPGTLAIERGDVRDRAQIVNAIETHQASLIVHGAAITAGLEREAREAALVAEVNILGTIAVLDAAIACGVSRVVQLGTGSVHGAIDAEIEAIEETLPAIPVSLYGITKFAAERIALRYRDTRELDVVVARLGVVFGRWEHETGVRDTLSLPFQLLKLAESGGIARFRPGLPDDWIYATDVAEAVVALLQAPSLQHGLYQIGTGKRWSIASWCDRLKQVFSDFDYVIAPDLQNINVGLSSPTPRPPFSIGRLRRDTVFSPRFGEAESFADYVQWRAQAMKAVLPPSHIPPRRTAR
jgi:nucleoside-diphosphate-sugar epimerase